MGSKTKQNFRRDFGSFDGMKFWREFFVLILLERRIRILINEPMLYLLRGIIVVYRLWNSFDPVFITISVLFFPTSPSTADRPARRAASITD